jgi:hypothetical protein
VPARSLSLLGSLDGGRQALDLIPWTGLGGAVGFLGEA